VVNKGWRSGRRGGQQRSELKLSTEKGNKPITLKGGVFGGEKKVVGKKDYHENKQGTTDVRGTNWVGRPAGGGFNKKKTKKGDQHTLGFFVFN